MTTRDQYLQKKASGICCRGNCDKPQVNGVTFCDFHRREQAQSAKKRFRNYRNSGGRGSKEERKRKIELGICSCDGCSAATSGNYKWCDKHRERMRECNKRRLKDPIRRLPFIWGSMMSRCYKSMHKSFQHYGARGISVCERWHTCKNFIADMGPAPTNHTLERIDNNAGYSPSNCRWATVSEQNQNKSNTIKITFDGLTLSCADWSRKCGMPLKVLRRRAKLGWEADKIFKTPARKTPHKRKDNSGAAERIDA